MDPSGKKRKGGAERARDQKKAALQADATKCLKIAIHIAICLLLVDMEPPHLQQQHQQVVEEKMLDSRWTRRP